MGRPKVPLIDRVEAIDLALKMIDRDGLDSFSIRKMGSELGVNGASFYHHFKDKDEILEGVRRLVLDEARVLLPRSPAATWQDYVTLSVTRWRSALLDHPNTAPLMTAGATRPLALEWREHIVAKMTADGVPIRFCHAIIDSAETLAFGSALFNPGQLAPRARYALTPGEFPHLESAVSATPPGQEGLFRLELQALLDGWTALVAKDVAPA